MEMDQQILPLQKHFLQKLWLLRMTLGDPQQTRGLYLGSPLHREGRHQLQESRVEKGANKESRTPERVAEKLKEQLAEANRKIHNLSEDNLMKSMVISNYMQ